MDGCYAILFAKSWLAAIRCFWHVSIVVYSVTFLFANWVSPQSHVTRNHVICFMKYYPAAVLGSWLRDRIFVSTVLTIVASQRDDKFLQVNTQEGRTTSYVYRFSRNPDRTSNLNMTERVATTDKECGICEEGEVCEEAPASSFC